MRLRFVAGATLTVALAFVASTGMVGSLTPTQPSPMQAAVSKPLTPPPTDAVARQFDPVQRSANTLASGVPFLEPAALRRALPPIAVLRAAQGAPASEIRPGRYQLRGTATWYAGTTTAMRLPRGTLVRICGSGGCVERRVSDYGPAARTGRIADLTPGDFQAVCGCGIGAGLTPVVIDVY